MFINGRDMEYKSHNYELPNNKPFKKIISNNLLLKSLVAFRQ